MSATAEPPISIPTANDPLTGLRRPAGVRRQGLWPNSALNSDYKNFGPRFGFAYDVTGNGHTVIRGGYAIFYPVDLQHSSLRQHRGIRHHHHVVTILRAATPTCPRSS